MIRMLPFALAATALTACATPTPEEAFVDAMTSALGGRDRIDAVHTLTIEGEGMEGNLGQDMTPEAHGQAFALTGYTRTVDLVHQRATTRQTRTPNFVYYQGPDARTQHYGIDGTVAYTVRPNGAASRASAATAGERRQYFYEHPLTLARLALDPSTRITNVRTENAWRFADIVTSDGLTLTLALDSETGQPSRVRSLMAHPNLGDVFMETRFADYVAVDGLSLPGLVTTTIDGAQVREIRVSRQVLEEVAELDAAPEAVGAAPEPASAAPTVEVREVAPGVWQLAGQSHHSAVVEMADHLVLIEAPQSEARTAAVLASARALAPDKPLTHVVNTHHHFDHSGGLRTAIAEGLTVVTHAGNRAFVESIAGRPFTLVPDALARHPRPVEIVTVDDRLVLEDETRTIEIYPVEGNPHGDLLLMAYLPRERILIEADAFSPEGGDYHPYAANLLENLRARRLRVDTILPLHGPVVPFGALVSVATAVSTP